MDYRPDMFRHNQSRLITSPFVLLQVSFVKQRCDHVHDGKRDTGSSATDNLCSLQGTAANKDGQAPETPLLLRIEEIITPADGITQCLLPAGCILPATRQHAKSVIEPPEHCLATQRPAPLRGQLRVGGHT